MGDARERDGVGAAAATTASLPRGAYLIPHGEFDWETLRARVVRPAAEPAAGARQLAPRGRALRAAAPLRRPPDRHPLGRRARVRGCLPRGEELEMLVAMADHAAIAVQSAQEAAAAARHRAALEQLLAVSSRLTETFSIDAILQSVCEGDPHRARVRERVHRPARARDGRASGRGRRTAGTCPTRPWRCRWRAPELERLLRPGVRGRGLLPGRARRGDATASHPSTTPTTRASTAAARTAWRNHWLLVPLWSRSGGLMGVIWADDPIDRMIPADAQAAGAARVRQPGDDGARHRRPVRGDAVPGRARPAHPAATTGGRSASGSSASRPGRCATATRWRSCCAT